MKKLPSLNRLAAALALAAGLGSQCAIAGTLDVTDSATGILWRIDLDRGTKTAIATNLNIPYGLTLTADGNTFVSNTGNNSILKIAPDGTQTTFASDLPYVSGLTVNPFTGAIIAAVWDNNTIKEIGPDGHTVRSFSGVGIVNPVSARYWMMGWNVGSLFVISQGPRSPLKQAGPGRVDCFRRNPDGSWTQEAPIATTLNFPYDAVPDSAGNLFVSEYGNNQILKFPAAGGGVVSTNPVVFATKLAPIGLAFDRVGSLYEADFGGVINKFVFTNGILSTNPVAVVTNLSLPTYIAFPPSPTLTIQRSGGNVVLTWPDPSFALESAGALTGTFATVPGASSPFTNAITAETRFFGLGSK